MHKELEKFFGYVQNSTPLRPEGHVEIKWNEPQKSTVLFSDIYKRWFPDHEGDAPELRAVTVDEFTKQLAVAFWACFGWAGKKPDSTQAQREFLRLLEEYYGLSKIKSSFGDDSNSSGDIFFEIGNDETRLLASISWAAD